jgi:uncharacterized protein (TIGR00255 family)
MTGYGEASYHSDSLTLAIELRSVNNRYLKVSLRATEPYNLLEPEFEKVIRRTIRRGTVQVQMRVQRQYQAGEFQINATALRGYLAQLRTLSEEMEVPHHPEQLMAQVLALPGVVPEPGSVALDLDEEWPLIEDVLNKALGKLQAMRQEEGKAMAQELLQLRETTAQQLAAIRDLAPTVVVTYRDRLLERVRGLLTELDVKIDRSDLIKEVSIFADRSDIAEEMVRLASHLDQFQEVMKEPESAGRKLEFLGQEMFRETNTIGSKASDVAISRHVVEIKAALEKVRELVQNIE